MRINLSEELIRSLIIREDFYNLVPEYFFLKEAGAKIAEAVARPGGCTQCTENSLVKPTIVAFMSHTVNMYLDCGKDALSKFKEYIRLLENTQEDFQIVVHYKETEEQDIQELLI